MKRFVILVANAALFLSLSLTAFATPTPEISEVIPSQGFDNQQITITIKGAKFYSPQTSLKLVKAGQPDIIATDVVVLKDTITANLDLNGQAPGQWDVIVTNIGKVTKRIRPTILAGAFTIVSAAPQITNVTPDEAVNEGQVTLTVSGTNFRPGITVSLENDNIVIPYIDIDLSKDGTGLKAKFDLNGALPGPYDLQVKNSDGSTALLNQAFNVIAAPVVVPTVTPAKPTPPTPTPVITPDPTQSKPPAASVKPSPSPVDPNSLFKSIFFDFNQATIRPDQVEALKTNLTVVQNHKKGYIILGGHADERGPNNYNIKLSAQRAETVKRFLVNNGIDVKRIITYAYGETSPQSLGHTEASWQRNRRVDLAIWSEIPNQKDALKK